MGFLKNIQNGSNWNIGFCDMTPEELVAEKRLKPIQWLKHPYKDRFFADPFIYNVTENEIVVFVEEFVFHNPIGLIVELVIDRASKKLKQRYELLRLPSHLSYPAIIRYEGEIYVYPENGHAGLLNLYRYDAQNHQLIEPECILYEPVADSTILKIANDIFMLVATKYPDNQENAYLYQSSSLRGGFELVCNRPLQTFRNCSRPAGDFFSAYGQLYRPAQNCEGSYGASINIMETDLTKGVEKIAFDLKPQGKRYPIGLHTINFYEGLCVVDGLGYLYPTLGRWYTSPLMTKLRLAVKRLIEK